MFGNRWGKYPRTGRAATSAAVAASVAVAAIVAVAEPVEVQLLLLLPPTSPKHQSEHQRGIHIDVVRLCVPAQFSFSVSRSPFAHPPNLLSLI